MLAAYLPLWRGVARLRATIRQPPLARLWGRQTRTKCHRKLPLHVYSILGSARHPHIESVGLRNYGIS